MHKNCNCNLPLPFLHPFRVSASTLPSCFLLSCISVSVPTLSLYCFPVTFLNTSTFTLLFFHSNTLLRSCRRRFSLADKGFLRLLARVLNLCSCQLRSSTSSVDGHRCCCWRCSLDRFLWHFLLWNVPSVLASRLSALLLRCQIPPYSPPLMHVHSSFNSDRSLGPRRLFR